MALIPSDAKDVITKFKIGGITWLLSMVLNLIIGTVMGFIGFTYATGDLSLEGLLAGVVLTLLVTLAIYIYVLGWAASVATGKEKLKIK